MTDAPRRIQRKRTKGWKMPPNTVYVGRGSKWGNPFKIGAKDRRGGVITADYAVEKYLDRISLGRAIITETDIKKELRGKNLACWCKEGEPCHADILLELANKEESNE